MWNILESGGRSSRLMAYDVRDKCKQILEKFLTIWLKSIPLCSKQISLFVK